MKGRLYGCLELFGALTPNYIDRSITVGQPKSIFSSRIETNFTVFVQVVYNIIENKVAVWFHLYFFDVGQVNGKWCTGPKACQGDLLIMHDSSVADQVKHNNGYDQYAQPYNEKKLPRDQEVKIDIVSDETE